jgi:xylulokinase
MGKFIMAHDLGTSGTKAVLTDTEGTVIASAESRYTVHYDADGGAEQDPEDWWQAIVETTHQILEKTGITADEVAGLCMSAQMVGTLPVDIEGKPLRRAMIWLDARAEKEGAILHEKTGFDFISGKACSAKVYWIKENEPDIYKQTHKILDCKDFLQYRMTGVFATDLSLAIATTYFNPWDRVWWSDVLEAMGVPEEKLPKILASTDQVGTLTAEAAQQLRLKEGIPIISGGGDVPCAVIGSGAISPGTGHLYLGTSAWVMASTTDFVLGAEGVYPSIGCDKGTFTLGGEMDNAGGCLKWFKENLMGKEDEEAAEKLNMSIFQYMDHLAGQVPDGAEGLLFLPWMWGERSPLDDDNLRGGFVNLGLNHTKAHMIRAMLEGIGYHLRWIFSAVKSAGIDLQEVNVIGGGASSDFWLQILADTTDVKLQKVAGPLDACARGAAMTAAVGLGIYKDYTEVEKMIKLAGAEFSPNSAFSELHQKAYENFQSLYPPLSKIANTQADAR